MKYELLLINNYITYWLLIKELIIKWLIKKKLTILNTAVNVSVYNLNYPLLKFNILQF